jgi:hypothetical protein
MISSLLIRILPLMFLHLASAEANAEVVSLACLGTSRVPFASPEEHWTFVLKVDLDRRTVTVNDLPSVPFFGDSEKDTVVFIASPPSSQPGVSSGSLNRLTGAVRVHIIIDEGGQLQIVTGTCKPATKLF